MPDWLKVGGINMKIEALRGQGMIVATLEGTLSAESVAGFYTSLNAAVVELGMTPNSHVLLVDARNLAIQPQEIVAMIPDAIDANPMRARRVAVVMGVTLARNQVRRAVVEAREDAMIFENIEQATMWLREGIPGLNDCQQIQMAT